jgi:hypothetical protein
MLEVEQAFTIGGTNIPLPSASVKVEETRGEAFGKATWRIHPDLTLEGGLRMEASTISQSGDANQEKSFFFAKPRFLATWTPMPNNQLRFRFERELGQLDFGDFAASADLNDGNVYGGNVDLEPEQRWISELTYERRFWGEGIVSIGYRHDKIIDVIDSLPLPGGLSATGNIGDGTLDQLSVNIVVPTDKLHIPGGRFTFRNDWNKTEVTDPTTTRAARSRACARARPTSASRRTSTPGRPSGASTPAAAGPEAVLPGSGLGLARRRLLRDVRRVQADHDPLDPRPAEPVGRFRTLSHGLFRPRRRDGPVHRRPPDRPAHLLVLPRPEDFLGGSLRDALPLATRSARAA